MHKVAGLTFLLVVATACDRQPAPDRNSAPAPEAPEAVQSKPVSAAPFKTARVKTPLPESFDFPFPYHRLNDNAKPGADGKAERRLLVEVLDIPPAAAETAIMRSLAAQGYVAGAPTQEKGRSRTELSRSDGAKVVVTVNPRLQRKKAPNATSTVHLVWTSGT